MNNRALWIEKKKQTTLRKKAILDFAKNWQWLPKVKIDGVLSVKNRLLLSLFCCVGYFLLNFIPYFGLISVRDLATSVRISSFGLTKHNESSVIAATKTAVGVIPMVLDFALWYYDFTLTNDEKEAIRNGLTCFNMTASIVRTWYSLFFARYYFTPYLHPLFVSTIAPSRLWIVMIVVPIEMFLAGFVLYVLEELARLSRITSIMAIGYLSETLFRVVSNLHMMVDYDAKILMSFCYLIFLVTLTEYVSQQDVKKGYTLSAAFDVTATTVRMDALQGLGETYFLKRVIEDFVTNLSTLIGFINRVFFEIVKMVANYKIPTRYQYDHSKVVKWLMLEEAETASLPQILQKIFKERYASPRELWVLSLIIAIRLILPVCCYLFMRLALDPTARSNRLVDEDITHHLYVKGVSRDRTSQEKYYKPITETINQSSLAFLLAVFFATIYGIAPYNLVSSEEFLLSYLRIIALKSSFAHYPSKDLPVVVVAVKQLSQEIPPADEY